MSISDTDLEDVATSGPSPRSLVNNSLAHGSLNGIETPTLAFFIRSLSGGGAQRDAILLANAISEMRIAACILTLVPDGDLRTLVDERVPIVAVPARRLATATFALRRVIAEIKPRFVFSSETAANLVAFAAVRGLDVKSRPDVVLREVTSPSIAKSIDPYLQNRIAFRLAGRIYARAERVLTLTEGARADLIENFGVPAERVTHLTSNAVIDPVTERRLRDAAAGPGIREKNLIIAIGRLSPEKDHLTLIRAIHILRRRKPVTLLIAGEGSTRPELQREIARLSLGDCVRLIGVTADSFGLLLKAEVAVSSSKFEGLGNVLIEALACGTPVVSTDCPYGPREILDGGRLGTLVPVGDAEALASAIEATLEGEPHRDKLREGAARFTAHRAATALADILGIA